MSESPLTNGPCLVLYCQRMLPGLVRSGANTVETSFFWEKEIVMKKRNVYVMALVGGMMLAGCGSKDNSASAPAAANATNAANTATAAVNNANAATNNAAAAVKHAS